MKSFTFFLLSSLVLLMLLPAKGFTQNVTLTTSSVAAANIAQGTNNNIVYAVKMDVSSLPATMNSIQLTLTGTHNNTDLTTINIFFNPTTPSLAGASQMGGASALFAAPHAYNLPFNFVGSQTISAGASGYFIITVNTATSAINGNTVKVNGLANPATFGYTTAPTITNNQTDIAGTQTILAAGVTLTSSAVAAANIAQGSNNNIVYIVKMDVTSLPVIVNSIQLTLTGTHNNTDLTTINIFFNATTPSLAGASQMGGASALFAAPHAYNLPFNFVGSQTISAGASGYFIITVNTATSAINGNTVKVNGLANAATFGYTTSPTVTNNQTDIAGTQTILAAGVTLTSSAVAAANIAQGTNNNIVYIVKMDVTSLPVIVNSIQLTLTGTHNNTDLTTINIFFNATAPSLAGASQMGSASALFAAPHAYNLPFNFTGSQTIAAGASGYFIITVNTATSAINGNTVKVNGLANAATFGYTTSPTVTNNQTDIAGTQTILAAGVTLTSSAVAAANIAQGSNNNIVYVVKMDVTSLPVIVNSMQFTLTGTHDNNDLTSINLFFNATAPSLTGAAQIEGGASALFAAPHAYNLTFNFVGSQTIAAGASGYFIVTVNTATSATNGNTVKVNGLANPVTFGYTTSPTVTYNQTDIAGTQTILAAGVTLTTSAIAPANIAQGSNNNIVYAVKMDALSFPAVVTSMQFTLTGTHDNNDLTTINLYFNPTAPSLTGATLVEIGASALFAAPHTYNLTFNLTGSQTVAAGASGYFIITVNVDAAATSGNTYKINGLADPVIFGYTTAPTSTNNQTDIAGTQTILAAGVTLTTSAIAAANIAQGTNNNIVYAVKMDALSFPAVVTSMQFTLTGTHDNNDLTTINLYFNAAAPSITGATQLEVGASALFAAPHTYNLTFNLTGTQTVAAGASGYFIIAVNTNAAATSGNTIKVNGLADPVIFGYTTALTSTNNQTDITGTQTILAAGITLTTPAITASNIIQGSSNNIVYAVKMDVTSLPVVVNSMQFTLTGTHDNNDLTTINLYFNAAAPSLTGATQLEVGASALFAAPHTYNLTFNLTGTQTVAAGASGYFIIAVNVDAAATTGNTVKLNGAINPAVFGFTTVPPVTNNQTDVSGTQTIGSPLPLRLIDFGGNIVNSQDVQLQWITASEVNTKDFEIEWCDDGLHFNKIAVVPAKNNTLDQQYSYLHKLAGLGNNYYRLKMSDKDGHFTISPVIKINVSINTTKIIVRQNPVINILNLQVRALKDEQTVFNLHSADGKTLASKTFNIKRETT